ncbi:MAG: type II toxin-antitoxin system RelE/ParE family toxin [Defluviitaleaceae bacterium]|nr:type II toxin-antitoxin system RelE/ParE family toxin [Defluviitaleaceae bacterium]
MFELIFYRDSKGVSPIEEYIIKLSKNAQAIKNERVKLKKIAQYFNILEEHGAKIGEPYVKHIDGDIWELRPINDRIFFFHWQKGKVVLLHHFIKKTNKTPAKEIEQAKRNQRDFLSRSELNE